MLLTHLSILQAIASLTFDVIPAPAPGQMPYRLLPNAADALSLASKLVPELLGTNNERLLDPTAKDYFGLLEPMLDHAPFNDWNTRTKLDPIVDTEAFLRTAIERAYDACARESGRHELELFFGIAESDGVAP